MQGSGKKFRALREIGRIATMFLIKNWQVFLRPANEEEDDEYKVSAYFFKEKW